MPQKIKKQIKRSMPWFMIFSLIVSSTVIGLVFNFNFKIYKSVDKDISMALTVPQVQADVASTTVTVKNAPPTFSVDPAEYFPPSSPEAGSTSTSPVNIGESISFIAIADDPESNSYYLAICSSNSITASTTGGPPTCNDTEFCLSGLTADEAQATCAYSDVADPDPSAETDEWYAFVCDNHTSEGGCSSASQGAYAGVYATSSPMYINHHPEFTAVITSDNFKDPGGTFTVTASTTDTDVMGGSDEVYLYVCPTNSWATSTGCTNGNWCVGTSTVDNVSCSFATGTPAVDDFYTYYAFVMDWHNLAATTTHNNTYTVNNVAPIVSNVILQSGNDIQLNIKGAAEIIASTTSASITDNNGCADIVSATSSIYWSSATSSEGCAADDNYCYQMQKTSCEQAAGSCGDVPNDVTVIYICTTTMAFHALPTDSATGSPYAATNWLAGIRAFDEALSGVSTTPTGVEVITSIALEVTQTLIAYGNVQAGQDTGTTTASTTVINYGNSPLDTNLSGTDMVQTGIDFIAAPQQEYSTTSDFQWGTEGIDLPATTSAAKLLDTETARPTSQTDISDYIYWGIGITLGKPSGGYEGTDTFAAVLDDNGW